MQNYDKLTHINTTATSEASLSYIREDTSLRSLTIADLSALLKIFKDREWSEKIILVETEIELRINKLF